MNTIIFLISFSSMQAGLAITPMNSMEQCRNVRDSTFEQVNDISLMSMGKDKIWCFNSTFNKKYFYGE